MVCIYCKCAGKEANSCSAHLEVGMCLNLDRPDHVGALQKNISNMNLVMPAAVPGGTVAARRMNRLRRRHRGRVSQIRRKHQHKRRDRTKGEKRIQRWQDAAQVSAGTAGKMPRNGSGSETA